MAESDGDNEVAGKDIFDEVDYCREERRHSSLSSVASLNGGYRYDGQLVAAVVRTFRVARGQSVAAAREAAAGGELSPPTSVEPTLDCLEDTIASDALFRANFRFPALRSKLPPAVDRVNFLRYWKAIEQLSIEGCGPFIGCDMNSAQLSSADRVPDGDSILIGMRTFRDGLLDLSAVKSDECLEDVTLDISLICDVVERVRERSTDAGFWDEMLAQLKRSSAVQAEVEDGSPTKELHFTLSHFSDAVHVWVEEYCASTSQSCQGQAKLLPKNRSFGDTLLKAAAHGRCSTEYLSTTTTTGVVTHRASLSSSDEDDNRNHYEQKTNRHWKMMTDSGGHFYEGDDDAVYETDGERHRVLETLTSAVMETHNVMIQTSAMRSSEAFRHLSEAIECFPTLEAIMRENEETISHLSLDVDQWKKQDEGMRERVQKLEAANNAFRNEFDKSVCHYVAVERLKDSQIENLTRELEVARSSRDAALTRQRALTEEVDALEKDKTRLAIDTQRLRARLATKAPRSTHGAQLDDVDGRNPTKRSSSSANWGELLRLPGGSPEKSPTRRSQPHVLAPHVLSVNNEHEVEINQLKDRLQLYESQCGEYESKVRKLTNRLVETQGQVENIKRQLAWSERTIAHLRQTRDAVALSVEKLTMSSLSASPRSTDSARSTAPAAAASSAKKLTVDALLKHVQQLEEFFDKMRADMSGLQVSSTPQIHAAHVESLQSELEMSAKDAQEDYEVKGQRELDSEHFQSEVNELSAKAAEIEQLRDVVATLQSRVEDIYSFQSNFVSSTIKHATSDTSEQSPTSQSFRVQSQTLQTPENVRNSTPIPPSAASSSSAATGSLDECFLFGGGGSKSEPSKKSELHRGGLFSAPPPHRSLAAGVAGKRRAEPKRDPSGNAAPPRVRRTVRRVNVSSPSNTTPQVSSSLAATPPVAVSPQSMSPERHPSSSQADLARSAATFAFGKAGQLPPPRGVSRVKSPSPEAAPAKSSPPPRRTPAQRRGLIRLAAPVLDCAVSKTKGHQAGKCEGVGNVSAGVYSPDAPAAATGGTEGIVLETGPPQFPEFLLYQPTAVSGTFPKASSPTPPPGDSAQHEAGGRAAAQVAQRGRSSDRHQRGRRARVVRLVAPDLFERAYKG